MQEEILYLEGRMPCYRPKYAFQVGFHEKSGKPKYAILDRSIVRIAHNDITNEWRYDKDFSRQYLSSDWQIFDEPMLVPCGRCIGCRLDYSRQWADRCILELQYHDSAYFLTLTYNDYCVPRSYYADPTTGEAKDSLTLCKKDWQDFMKRLRYYFPDDNLRFFMCGEYGPSTWRPHFHAIVYGLHLDDLVLYERKEGYNYFTSKKIDRVWSRKVTTPSLLDASDDVKKFLGVFEEESPSRRRKKNVDQLNKVYRVNMGRVLIGEVTWETCAYTARYMMKKLKGPEAQFYADFNLTPPFVLMSRKPGIARQYYDDHPDLYEYSTINVETRQGGRKIRPPRYFDKLFDADDPDRMQEIKSQRRIFAEQKMQLLLDATSLSVDEYLELQERTLEERIKSLKRSVF